MEKDIYLANLNQDYAKVILLSENSNDIDILLMRANAFCMLNQYENAINCLIKNEKILIEKMPQLIDMHMFICLSNKKYFEALEALKHYEDYPYFSQEVEEKFIEYKKIIKLEYEKNQKNEEDDNIEAMLSSNDNERIQNAINILKKENFLPYVGQLEKIMVDSNDILTRIMTLSLFIDKKYSSNVKYKMDNKIIDVVPKEVKAIINDDIFNNLLKKCRQYKDMAYSKVFEQLLATYAFYYFPFGLKYDENSLFEALDILTKKYLRMPNNKRRPSPEVEKIIAEIEKANCSFN